ncbi:hypothetical protein B7494_g5663 [Chlorociboria aeruginascens]|nr:hypothetical protein B7494_g5663 [Chlorociboria aeruginascens]
MTTACDPLRTSSPAVQASKGMGQSGPTWATIRSEQDGLRKGSLSPRPQPSHDTYAARTRLVEHPWVFIWSCDNCGREGGMTVLLEQCPECEHHRCMYCKVEAHIRRSHLPRSNPTIACGGPTKNSTQSASKLKHRSVGPESPMLDGTQDDSITVGSSEVLGLSTSQLDGTTIAECIRRLSPESTAVTLTPSSTLTRLPLSTPNSVSFSEILNYNECAESENELENDDDELNNNVEDDQAGMATVMNTLESYLHSVLSHDPELVARLIPGIYSQLQLGLGRVVYKTAPSRESSRSSGSNKSMQLSSTTPGNIRSDSQRNNNGDNPEDRREDSSSKRQKKDSDEDSVQRPGFACHFHKRYPERYCTRYNKNFRTCMGPGSPELRRMKYDHLKRIHRDRDEPDTRTAGINDSQWSKIEDVFKAKRGMSNSEKEKHDIDRWNEIWKILFPEDPQPPHPWDSSFQPSPTEDFVANFNHFNHYIRRYREEGYISSNESARQYIEHAARLAFGSHTTSEQNGFNGSWLPQINNPKTGSIESFSSQIELPQFPFNPFPDQHFHGSELLPSTIEGIEPQQFSQDNLMLQMPITADSNPSYPRPYFQMINSSPALGINLKANAEQSQSHVTPNQESPNSFNNSNVPRIEISIPILGDSLPIDDDFDRFDSNFSFSSLEVENERPEATSEWKNNRDRNMGLDRP